MFLLFLTPMWETIITTIFEVCILPLLALLTTFVIRWLNSKRNEALAKTDNETTQKYINIAADIIENAVIATTETYVKTLKAEGKFDKEAQLKALEATKDAVLKTLSDDAKQHLMGSIGDLESYITNKIEAVIKNTK
jgi:hypothetical protein